MSLDQETKPLWINLVLLISGLWFMINPQQWTTISCQLWGFGKQNKWQLEAMTRKDFQAKYCTFWRRFFFLIFILAWISFATHLFLQHWHILMFISLFVCLFFNGISTFLDYLMPNPSFKKNSSGAIQPIAWRIRGFIRFQRVFVWKWT